MGLTFKSLINLFQNHTISTGNLLPAAANQPNKFLKKLLFTLLILLVGVGSVSGTTYTATQTGSWNVASTWGGTGYPQAGDDAVINQNYTITLTDNASCRNLNFGNNGVIALGLYDLSIGGNLTFLCSTGPFTTSTGYVVLNGTSQTINLCTGGGNSIPNLRLANSTSVSMGPQTNLTITGNFDCQTGSSTFTNNTTSWNTGALVVTGTCTAPNCSFTVAQNNVTNAIDFSSSISNPIQVGGVIDNQPNSKITFGSKNVYTTTAFTGTYTSNIIHTGVVTVLSSLKQFKSNVVNGSWNVKGSWLQSTDGGVSWSVATAIPTSSDIVTIQSGHTIQLIAAAASNNLTINGTLDLGTFALTGSGVLTLSSSGTLLIGGASNYPTGFTTSTLNDGSTVNYYLVGAQTISSQPYYNLILSGSGTKTLPVGVTTISGNLTLSGASTTTTVANLTIGGNLTIGDGTTFTAAGYNFTVIGTTTLGTGTSGTISFISTAGTKIFTGLVTVNAGATWDNSINEALTFRGGLTSYGGGNAGTGIYTFNTNNQTITGAIVIPNITVTGVILTNNGTLTVSTALIGSGTFLQGVNSVLYIGGTSTITTLNATNTGNTVYYNAAGSQTVNSTNYYNLSFTGSGTKIITTGFNVSGNLNIAGPPTAALTSTINVLTNSLTLGGTAQADGTYGSTVSGATNKKDTYFNNNNAYKGIVTVFAACVYGTTVTSNITFTPVINMTSTTQDVSTSFTSGKYFVLNVIKGLVYQVYTGYSNSALKMAVYEEGNATSALLASSLSNSGNPDFGNANNVYLSFTSPLSGQLRIMITRQNDCASVATTGLTVRVNVSGGNNTQDNPTAAGTDNWIGQVYDSPSLTFLFENYIGYYGPVAESFQEMFGTAGTFPNGATDDNTSFNVYSNGVVRASVKDVSYNVRYLMNSTHKGFYSAYISSDDGSKLTVDGTVVYNHWDPHSPTVNNDVLLSLNGASSLMLDYFEQGGQNIIGISLTKLLDNKLTTNTTQTLCKSTVGAIISGDDFATLPTGITNGTYQWYYNTPNDPAKKIIVGATGATFTPNSSAAPFNNVVGVYYLYRVASLKSVNNYDPNPYTPTNESNVASVRVKSCPNYWIGDASSTDWNTVANWSDGTVPYSGDDVEFATTTNGGNGTLGSLNNLTLNGDFTVGNLKNTSQKQLVISPATSLTVNGSITTTDENQIYIQSSSTLPNGTLIFPNASNVKATVEMYSKASCLSPATKTNYRWQYFGIPLSSVVASPTFDGSYIRVWDETQPTATHWVSLNNSSSLSPFIGYEITQLNATTILFKGTLVNSNFNATQTNLTVTPSAGFPGQHIYANPYTAAIDIRQLIFGTTDVGIIENTVYLYSAGSFAEWTGVGGVSSNGLNPGAGQYTAVPINTAGNANLPRQIPSMQAMLVRAHSNVATTTFGIPYTAVMKNALPQRVSESKDNSELSGDLTGTVISVVGSRYSDRMWLFTESSCTHNFDNGWDGTKLTGNVLAPQIYAVENDGNYQVNTVDDINNTRIAFQAGEDVEYMLTFTHQNLASKYASVYLVDSVENKTVDITTTGTTYKFVATSTPKAVNRFKIVTRYYEKDAVDANTQLKVFNDNSTIFVDNASNVAGDLYMYDVMGRFVGKKPFGANAITSYTINTITGAYIVKAVTNSEKVSKRIILKYQN